MIEDRSGAPMPLYQSHKLVRALPIGQIFTQPLGDVTIYPKKETNIAPFSITGTDAGRFRGKDDRDWGYLVEYEDGYLSWSPTKAFEEGYHKVDDAQECAICSEDDVPADDLKLMPGAWLDVDLPQGIGLPQLLVTLLTDEKPEAVIEETIATLPEECRDQLSYLAKNGNDGMIRKLAQERLDALDVTRTVETGKPANDQDDDQSGGTDDGQAGPGDAEEDPDFMEVPEFEEVEREGAALEDERADEVLIHTGNPGEPLDQEAAKTPDEGESKPESQ